MRDTAAYIQYSDALKAKNSRLKDGYDKINRANAVAGPEFLLDVKGKLALYYTYCLLISDLHAELCDAGTVWKYASGSEYEEGFY